MVDVNIILNDIGAITRAQWIQLMILAPVSALCGFHLTAMVYLGYNQAHHCSLTKKNEIMEECGISWNAQQTERYIPWNEETNSFDNCLRYVYDSVNCTFWNSNVTSSTSNVTMLATESCHTWIYDTSELQTTVTGEFNLVCEDKQKGRLSQAIFMFGVGLGTTIWGQIADRFGRKITIFTPLVIAAVFGIATAYSNSFLTFTILRFFIGFTSFPAYSSAYVLGIETVKQGDKVLVSQFLNAVFPVGVCILPVLAYFIQDWRALQLWISIPAIPAAFLTCFLFESPPWLISCGKYSKAYKIVKKLKRNKKNFKSDEVIKLEAFAKSQKKGNSLPEQEAMQLDVDKNDVSTRKEKEVTMIDVLKLPNMRKKSFILFYVWMVCSLVYYGLTLNSAVLGGNIFLNLFLSAVVEIPALILSVPFIQKWGRRPTIASTLVCIGVTCVSIMFVTEDVVWLGVTLSTTGKFLVAIAFNTSFIYAADIYPTPVRNVGLGVCSSWARVGGTLAPFIAMLDVIGFAVPYIVFGLAAAVGGLLILFLPETLGKKIPETLEEAEQFGRNYEGIIAFICNKITTNVNETDRSHDNKDTEA